MCSDNFSNLLIDLKLKNTMRVIRGFQCHYCYSCEQKNKKCRGHWRPWYQNVPRILRKDSLYFFLDRGIQSGRGREIGSAESRIPSIGDRQGNCVGSRYRCGRGSVVGPFGNLGNDGIRMVGSTLARQRPRRQGRESKHEQRADDEDTKARSVGDQEVVRGKSRHSVSSYTEIVTNTPRRSPGFMCVIYSERKKIVVSFLLLIERKTSR